MDRLKSILELVASAQLTPEDAAAQVRSLGMSFADLGHTKLDLHRMARRGVAEAVYGEGKTAEQILTIAMRLDEADQPVLCTRVSPEKAAVICAARPDFAYCELSRIVYKHAANAPAPRGLVAVLAAGTSDLPVMEEAALSLELMGSRVERVRDVGVAGIHRLFASASEVLSRANAVVVVAGMEGALPTVVGGLVSVPVVAVPTSVGYGAAFGGIAALLGMLNSCAGGVSVVNIDNGFGAAMVAHLINAPRVAREGCHNA